MVARQAVLLLLWQPALCQLPVQVMVVAQFVFASYCGLFGLKPSRGRTPWGPQMSEAMHGAAIQHVLTKTVRDSAAMLDATHGEDRSSLFTINVRIHIIWK